MAEDTTNNDEYLHRQCLLAEQNFDRLNLAYQRLEFAKNNQIEELEHKLAKANQDLNQLFGQFQATTAALEEVGNRNNFLEAENSQIKDQLRYASVYHSDLSKLASHYFGKTEKLEFTVDYKNYLLGNQQDLLEHDANRRADDEFFKSDSDADRIPLSQQFLASVLSEIVAEPKSNSSKVSPAPSRTNSFGRCQREAGKVNHFLSNPRLMRKLTSNKLAAAPRRK